VEKELEDGSRKDLAQEIGDLLFSVANVARLAGINPETALRGTNRKFVDRFHGVEAVLKKQGKNPGEASLEEMDEIWEEIKKKRKHARKRAPGKKAHAGAG
jgi:ATP diphosphatase